MKMKQIMKMSLMIAVALILVGAFPDKGYAATNGDYTIKDGILTDYVGVDRKVTIPSTVKEIGMNAFFGNCYLEEVIIPGNVKVIDSHAFGSCHNLKTVSMKKGVETIEAGAFESCENIINVIIPKTVIRLKYDNFRDSKWLKNNKDQFMIVGNGILIDYKGSSSKVTLPSGVKAIGSDAFHRKKNITQIVMNRGLKKICDNAFSKSTKLKSVTIPSSVNYIGEAAFTNTPWFNNNKKEFVTVGNGILLKYNGKRSKIVLPSSITCINEDVFQDDKKIKEVVLKGKVTAIMDDAFWSCTNLSKINIPSSVKTIGINAFNETSITSVTIPSSTTTLGNGSFGDCAKLTEINFAKNSELTSIGFSAFSKDVSLIKLDLPDKLLNIGSDAFFKCTKLQEVNLPESLTSIEYSAFSGCRSLTSVVLPKNVSTIQSDLFNGCSSLSKVNLSGNVTSIEYSAFSGCSKLSDFTLPPSVTHLEDNAFFKCSSLKEITLNSKITNLPRECFYGCTSLGTIKFENQDITFDSDALTGTQWVNSYSGDFVTLNGTLIHYKGKESIVHIPDTIHTIQDSAFESNSEITEVIMPPEVKHIGNFAFSCCSKLKRVILPKSIEFIGYKAFNSCMVLDEIITDNNESTNRKTEGLVSQYAFEDCSSLKKVTLPENISEIDTEAFINCSSLTEIQLPDTLDTIESEAFSNCTNLTKISFNGTISNLGDNVFTTTAFYTQEKKPMVLLQNVLLAYHGNDKSLTLPDSCTVISNEVFLNNTALKEIKFSNGLTYIGPRAFAGCKNLKTVTMPLNRFDVGSDAFLETPWLMSQKDDYIILPNGVLYKYQGKDKTVTIPDTVKGISPYAFEGTKINKVIIPGSVKYIGNSSFYGSKVEEVYIEDGVEEIDKNAFVECTNIKLLCIPSSVKKIGIQLTFCEHMINNSYIIECSKGSKAYDYAVENKARIRLR